MQAASCVKPSGLRMSPNEAAIAWSSNDERLGQRHAAGEFIAKRTSRLRGLMSASFWASVIRAMLGRSVIVVSSYTMDQNVKRGS